MTTSRLLLGPVLLALLLGIGLYGAVCVNARPSVPPSPVPTLAIVAPASPPTNEVFTVPPTPTMTPTPREAILATPGPTRTRTPMPTWTPTSEPTNTRVPQTPVQRGMEDERKPSL